jgi:hypothetical protein
VITSCAMALILLMDASGSITDIHMREQTIATSRALVSEQITNIVDRMPGGIAVKAIAFGPWPEVMVPWMMVRNSQEASQFAQQLRAYQRDDQIQNGTLLGRALNYAIDQFDTAPCEPDEQVIDVSTDGESEPSAVQAARERAEQLWIKINAIGIGRPELLNSFLYQNVVTSNGFHITVDSWSDFERAMRRKLALEIAQALP